ncbi:alpha-glucuronidase family glycosyl hydrolase [Paenibacillus silviterrae]|uniref:alpha-glucuronidase family glycosyl hydrolase n=1 Tax=Paenibacillus silviterrae TaxID=3242194 RepID=UPI002542B67F|nr:alpha-glucuronidase family glycosyl hydrolase [Paenibacillus chinjuensis]
MPIAVAFRQDSPRVCFAVRKLREAIEGTGAIAEYLQLEDAAAKADIIIVTGTDEASALNGMMPDSALGPEGFEIRRSFYQGKSTLFIMALDESGAMYGTLELAEQLRLHEGIELVPNSVKNPRFPFRAIKFNLPWSSYRQNECFTNQMDTVRDLAFWQRFLDMMAENRFNALTLWNLHPYPYMFRSKNFPKATPFSDEELAQWREYWTSLFRMAKERGIETYLVNWNIFVSGAFRKHYEPDAIDDQQYHHGSFYSSEQIKRYTRECVTQLIEEYPDLTGIGISSGERMNGMSPQEQQDWIQDVYYEGVKQANRPVKLIHRAPFSVDPAITRNAIDNNGFIPEPVWVEVKFNWSHAYSSTRLLLTHGGSNGMEGYWNPPPEKYKITWMVRNEDFFTLRWAQPGFIREHIALNGQEYVGGYYIGSECFIPGKDYSHASGCPHMTWTYAFEKHWLYYMLWGRLLYDPATPDDVFTSALAGRYGKQAGQSLLKAYSLVCEMPRTLASYIRFTWDFTLYSEGFISTDRSEFNEGKAFISLQDLMASPTSDPTYLSIRAYVDRVLSGQSMDGFVTPLQAASKLETNATEALALLDSIPHTALTTLDCEKADVEAWAHLCLYLSDKLRAGVCYETYRRTGDEMERSKAKEWLEESHAAGHWENLIAVTKSHYVEQPLMHLGKTPFSWELFRANLAEDIAFVGGE